MLEVRDKSNSIVNFVLGFCSSSFAFCSMSIIEFFMLFLPGFFIENTKSSSFFLNLKRVFLLFHNIHPVCQEKQIHLKILLQFVVQVFQRKQILIHFEIFLHTKGLLFRHILVEKKQLSALFRQP